MSEKVWKPVPGYESLYEVSDQGDVRSIAYLYSRTRTVMPRNSPRNLRLETSRDGYKRVVLCINGFHKHFSVHRLVAMAFIPNPSALPQINHIDENPANNHVENLEWCDGKANCNHGLHRQRIVERQTNAKYHSKAVSQYTLDGRYIATYPSTREAERQTGIASEQISRVCKGKNNHAGHFFWKYADNSVDSYG